jgi:hypothetical protein
MWRRDSLGGWLRDAYSCGSTGFGSETWAEDVQQVWVVPALLHLSTNALCFQERGRDGGKAGCGCSTWWLEVVLKDMVWGAPGGTMVVLPVW